MTFTADEVRTLLTAWANCQGVGGTCDGCKEHAQDMLRAYAALLEASAWQPIETIPDPVNSASGDRVLVAVKDNPIQVVTVIGAHRLINAWPKDVVTHWCPLPSPPPGDGQ